MLSISDAKSPDKAKDYYERDNYYLKGEAGEIQSAWWGNGAELLGLSGVVDGDTFVDLLSGKLPDGKLLGIMKQGERVHRPGYDFTFSAPKSVSILAEISGDRRLIEAHNQAVNIALGDIEQLATARRSVSGTMHYETTGNLVVAKFQHGTSRALDPQLHTHAVVLNMTQRQDGKFLSFASQSKQSVQKEGRLGFMEQVYARKLHFGAVYRAALAQSIVKLGYNIRMTHADGRFEIEGIPEAAIKAFSKRREDIEAALEARGLEGGKASEKAALMTRQHKKEVDKATLMADWKAQTKDLGLNVDNIVQAAKHQEVSQPQKTPADIQATAIEAVNYARLHLSERQAAFLRDDLKEVASTHALGIVGPEDVEVAIDEAVKEGSLLLGKHQGALMLTTPEAKALETENIALMQRAKGTVQAISDFHRSSPLLWDAGLNKDQFNAASLILTTTDGVVGVQGYAGTGKTTMLRAVNEFAELMGVKVRGMAPTAVAAAELGKSANIQSQTLDSFLIDMQKLDDEAKSKTDMTGETQAPTEQHNHALSEKSALSPVKELWVLDEFSLTASRPMGELLKQREAKGVNMVILGDIQQLGSVEAGKPGEQFQKAGMTTAVMQTIVRQRNSPDLMEAVYAIIGEDVPRAIHKLKDSVQEIADKDERLQTIAKDYLKLTPTERKDTLVSAPANEDREILNSLIRDGLKAQGHLQGPDIQTDILINKSLTLVEKTRASLYEAGNVVKFGKDIGEFKKHEYYIVSGQDTKQNLVTLKSGNTELVFSPVKHGGGTRGVVSVFEVGKRSLAQGDVIRWTMNQKHLKRLNSTTGVVQSINKKRAKVLDVNGHTHALKLNDKRDQHYEYGHVWTVYASQSKTLKYVLGHDESKRKFLTNQKNFYVTISRAEVKAKIYIDDKQAYIAKLQDSLGDKVAALELQPISQDKAAPQIKKDSSLSASTGASEPGHNSHQKSAKIHPNSQPIPNHTMTKPKTTRSYDVIRLHEKLADIAPHVVEKLLGEPNRQLSNATTWRYGKKGSLAITVQGEKAGLWHDFETGDKGNLLTLISQTAGLSRTQTHEAAAELIGTSLSAFETTLPTFTRQKIALPESRTPGLKDQQTMDYAKTLVKKSMPIHGTLAEKYLQAHRSITLQKLPDSLRFIPSIKHGQSGQHFPALLSIATNDKGETQAVQITYLDSVTHNKAQVFPNKVQHGRMRFGAHVVLQTGTSHQKEVLIAEGVETALSLAQAKPEATVIATLSVSNMKNIKLQGRAEIITLCADNDKGKDYAFGLLQKAIPHLQTQANRLNLAIPDTHQTDFNDVLKQGGLNAVKALLDKTETLTHDMHLNDKQTPSISPPTPQQVHQTHQETSQAHPKQQELTHARDARMSHQEKHPEHELNPSKNTRVIDFDLEL